LIGRIGKGGDPVDDMKKAGREAEETAKEAWRKRDGEDLADKVGNAGDDIRKELGNAGDTIRREADEATDDRDREPAGTPRQY
jgi:hypothetical protein